MSIPNFSTTTQTASEYRMDTHGVDMRETVTLGTTASGNYVKGTCMAKLTSNDKFYAYDDAEAGGAGLGLNKGILVDAVDASSADQEGVIDIHGTFDESALTGIDANGKTDLPLARFV